MVSPAVIFIASLRFLSPFSSHSAQPISENTIRKIPAIEKTATKPVTVFHLETMGLEPMTSRASGGRSPG